MALCHHALKRKTGTSASHCRGVTLYTLCGTFVLLILPCLTRSQETYVNFKKGSPSKVVWLGDEVSLPCSLDIDSDPNKRGNNKDLFWQNGDLVNHCRVNLKSISLSPTADVNCPDGFTGHVSASRSGRDTLAVVFTMRFNASKVNEGRYRCLVIGALPTPFSAYTSVNVLTPPTCSGPPSSSSSAVAGDGLAVFCTTHNGGNPKSSLKWKVSGVDTHGSERGSVLNDMTITYTRLLKPSDRGLTFECTESNPNTTSTKTCSVAGPLDVLYAPRGQITRLNISKDFHSDIAVYSCHFDAHPKVTRLEWFADGNRVRSGDFDDNFIVGGDGKLLYVLQYSPPSQKVMDTSLECKAGNLVGNVTVNVTHTYTAPPAASPAKSSPGVSVSLAMGTFITGVVITTVIFVLVIFIQRKRKQTHDIEQTPQSVELLTSDLAKRSNRYEQTELPNSKLAERQKSSESAALNQGDDYDDVKPANSNNAKGASRTADPVSDTIEDKTTDDGNPPLVRLESSGYTRLNVDDVPDDYYETIYTKPDGPVSPVKEATYANV